MTVVALVCLALACGWEAAVLRSDDLRRRRLSGRTYRSVLGWTDPETPARRRGYWVAMTAAAVLIVAVLITAVLITAVPITAVAAAPEIGAVLGAVCAAVLILWLARYTRTRFTSLCLTLLAASLLLHQLALLVPLVPPHAGALLASFCAAQLYLVAGIRKLRSPQFLSGRVVLDSFAYATLQASAGNRDFLPLLRPAQLGRLLVDRRVRLGCRAAAIGTVVTELTLGLGAIGLLPAMVTLILAVSSHLAFLLVSPVRILPFSTAAVGLLFLANTHPIMAGIS